MVQYQVVHIHGLLWAVNDTFKGEYLPERYQGKDGYRKAASAADTLNQKEGQ